MKICDYCGKENEEAMSFCVGCGTVLNAPKDTPTILQPKNRPRILNARFATVIFLAYMVPQFFYGFLTGVTASNRLNPMGIIISLIIGGVAMIWMAFALIPKSIKDTSPIGAAWVLGEWKSIINGLIIGLIIGTFNEMLPLVAKHHTAHSPFHQIAFTSGLPQMIWVLITVIMAPTLEEMLFRGILYGGYCKSFGSLRAAIFITLLFVAIHFPYYIHDLLAVFGIIAGALATLWCRLHWNAIGPAVAVHVGYNFIIAFSVIYWTWLK